MKGSYNGVWYQTGDAQANLTASGQWNFNTDTNRIQVFCVGNPATNLPGVTSDLRAAIDTCCIYVNGLANATQHDVTFQNLTIQFTGGTAINSGGAGGTVNNMIIRDLVVQWTGGGNIGGANVSTANSRYGDGWDIEGGCSGMLMERIWWHQVYDTGPGPQCSGPHQDNITVRNNVLTSCTAFFSTFMLGGVPTVSGLAILNNTVDCTQKNWSNNPSQRPNALGYNANVYALTINTIDYNATSHVVTAQTNMYVANNIFAGISGIGTSPGFGLISTGWNIAGSGINASNPYTAGGSGGGPWLDYNCWPVNPLSTATGHAQWIALSSANYALSDWCKGTNIGGAGTFSPALEAHGIFVDPVFTSQSAFNFKLGAGSPCLGVGANLYTNTAVPVPPCAATSVVWDFNHNPRPASGAFSMGAFQ